MKKMSFTITTTLKDKLALMSKIYMSNRKSGIYPMAVSRHAFIQIRFR